MQIKGRKSKLHSESGQGATEYMLLISVVVIAVVASAYTFVPTFERGVKGLAFDVERILTEHEIGSVSGALQGVSVDIASTGGFGDGGVGTVSTGNSGGGMPLDVNAVPVPGTSIPGLPDDDD